MANDNSINERGGINVPLSGGGYASIFAHRPLKVKKSKKNPKLIGETYNKEVTEKWMEKTIRDSARAHGHDPDVAAALWRAEGGMSRQSQISRKGKGSYNGLEDSWGPFQLYLGGGLGNAYEEKYGADLRSEVSQEHIKRQIDFAMREAQRTGWKHWYGRDTIGLGVNVGVNVGSVQTASHKKPYPRPRPRPANLGSNNSTSGTTKPVPPVAPGDNVGAPAPEPVDHTPPKYLGGIAGGLYSYISKKLAGESVTEEVNYSRPQFDVEWEEANRYPYLEKLGKDGWEKLAKTGRVVRVNKDNIKQIGNTGADGSESLDDLEPDKVARLKQAIDAGTIEMPIVVKQPDGSYDLVAGNTRLIGLISTHSEAKVWLVDASKLEEYGVGKITKQNATKDAPIGSEYSNVKKLGLGSGKPNVHDTKATKNSNPNTLFNLGIGEDTNQTYKDWEDKVKANREKAIAAGFVKPDGSADTRAHRASIAKQQDAKSAAANAKYWKENPKGKYEKIGNVTSMVMPPSLTDPKAEKANQAKIDKVWKDRTQAYKDKVKASGGKFIGDKLDAPRPRPIQATPTADDPKPWVRTKPMPRPWRKDQKPLPMGDVAVQYNKDNPKAAKSREQQIQIKQMARDEATRKGKDNGKPQQESDYNFLKGTIR